MKAKILTGVTASIASLGIVAVATRSNVLAVGYIVISVCLLVAVSIGGILEVRAKKQRVKNISVVNCRVQQRSKQVQVRFKDNQKNS
jgi:hypothetical protein